MRGYLLELIKTIKQKLKMKGANMRDTKDVLKDYTKKLNNFKERREALLQELSHVDSMIECYKLMVKSKEEAIAYVNSDPSLRVFLSK